MEIQVREAETTPNGLPVELVERKGLGHPDTICDGVAEHISRTLCRYYQARFGRILHHNVDKVLLVGGASRAAFGGGEVIEPIEMYLAGRATQTVMGEQVPVAELAVEACRAWLRANLRHLDVDKHVRVIPRIRPGSADLTDLFAREGAVPLANDTSCGVGFAPLSPLERMVLAVERSLNSSDVKQRWPAIGEDIKVMGVRAGGRVTLTIGCAFVAAHLADLDAYCAAKQEVQEIASAACATSPWPVSVVVNAGDDVERGQIYLTALGTSAESGDDGEVGRGNRVCGLITPYRPMTLEAAAGKNPVNHVGKLYNVAAVRIASDVAACLKGGATCMLVSQIGRPVDDPQVADVGITGAANQPHARREIEEILREHLRRLPELRAELLSDQLSVF